MNTFLRSEQQGYSEYMEVLRGISIQQVLLEYPLIVQLPVMAVIGLSPVQDACKVVFCMTIGQL